ncbi:MAG TPA: shikimate kinase, partial [Patescibacteria group bacterium]
NDSLTIFGGDPKPALIDTYNDHRMAMAFAIAGTKLQGIKINHPEVVSKTFPDFWKKLNNLGIRTSNKNNIALIGMRGSGKTTIGKMLAQKLDKKFLDLDEELIKKAGQTLSEIINNKGWDYFREQEAIIAKEKKAVQNSVIATGGGVILRQENIEALQKNGILIFLNAHPKILAKRIGTDRERPAFHHGFATEADLTLVLQERQKLYEDNADLIINTNGLAIENVVKKIIKKIN